SLATSPRQMLLTSQQRLSAEIFFTRPAAKQSKPRAKIPPLWVFTPPVAAYIACSQAIPIGRRIRNCRSAGLAACASPSSANRANHGVIAIMLRTNKAWSISRWEPLLSLSTSPGFGVSSSSCHSASAASAGRSTGRGSVASKPVIDHLLHAGNHLLSGVIARTGTGMSGLVTDQAASEIRPQRLTPDVAVFRADHIQIPQPAEWVRLLQFCTVRLNFRRRMRDAPQGFRSGG